MTEGTPTAADSDAGRLASVAGGDSAAIPAQRQPPPTDLPEGVHRRKSPPEQPAEKPSEEAEPAEKPKPSEVLGELGPTVIKEKPDWEHFAPEEPLPPSAPRRVVRAISGSRVARGLRHEWTLASLAALVLTAAVNWRVLLDPAFTLPGDLWESAQTAYLLAWDGYALRTDPAAVWDLNAYYPADGVAFSDAFLGYGPAGLIGAGPVAAVLRLNVVYLLAQALAFVGGYALARQLGVGRIAGAVAGAGLAFAPWRLGQGGHLEVLSYGGIALALAMLCRGHGWRLTRDPDKDRTPRPGWAIGGWLVATWQVSLGWSLGVVFAYVLAAVALIGPVWWLIRRRGWPGWGLLVADAVGVTVFAVLGAVLALPYVLADNVVRADAPGLKLAGYVAAPAGSLLWGDRHAGLRERLDGIDHLMLLPGFILFGLAAAGLVYSVWSLWTRGLLLAGVAATVALGLGERGPDNGRTYEWLSEQLPGLRDPYRLIVWTTLLLALLAAGAVAALGDRAHATALERGLPRAGGLAHLVIAVPLVLILVEGLGAAPRPDVPAAPSAVRSLTGPALVLPSDAQTDALVGLWLTERFPRIANGPGDVVPDDLVELRQQVATFPDQASVDYLRRLGIRTVVLLPDRVAGTPWENAAAAPYEGLDVTRQESGGAITYRLN